MKWRFWGGRRVGLACVRGSVDLRRWRLVTCVQLCRDIGIRIRVVNESLFSECVPEI